ncbi:hypothetical protein LA080_001519 [Diaporthe eres]|nr:hypothetical protein LA080_001519 [Diaporthe eres]
MKTSNMKPCPTPGATLSLGILSLWVDAICIDQRENDTSKRERDLQVRIMGAIFHAAQKTLLTAIYYAFRRRTTTRRLSSSTLSPAAHKAALHEMYRSLQTPGIYHFIPSDDTIMKECESFRAWFDFMIYLNEASGFPRLISGRTDTEHSQGPGVQLYFDICMAGQEGDAANVLERGYGGAVHGREGLIKLARHIRSTKHDLHLLRNHSLCILDKDNMIAVTDYWCQERDEVFVFPGTDSLFVLRKQLDGDCYRLVGPALADRLLRVGNQEWRSEGDDLQDIVLI